MYAYSGNAQEYENYINDYDRSEIAYWRKHPNLHGWMENLYESRMLDPFVGTGKIEVFNGIPLLLNLSDIEQLEQDIINKNLPPTQGFFFGSNRDENSFEYDLEFVTKAKELLSQGQLVWYDSSW